MADKSQCFPELYSPDLTGYVLTSRLGSGGAAGGHTRTQGPKGDDCGQEGLETPTSPPEEAGDCHDPHSEPLTRPGGEESSRPIKKELIPVKRLALEDLPHNLQTDDNLKLILEMCERMALVHIVKRDHEHDGTHMQRPDVSSAITTLGFIYAFRNTRAGFEAVVVTSPDVLPTTEAVERSVLEVALDTRAFWRAESMPGSPLPSWSRTDTREKFAIAAYAFGMNDWLCELSFSRSHGYHPTMQPPVPSSGKDDRERTVCVVSWTKTEGKCVSFGQVVQETSGQLLHDAPVPPDCLGSLVVVFSSQNSFWLAKGRGDQRGGVAMKVDWNLVKKAALLLQGFIPILDLTLDLLPKEIRSEDNLKLIQETSKLVVKVNVNKLSEKRPKDDPFKARGYKSMTGSGIIRKYPNTQKMNLLAVITNKHVLYDSLEAVRSTIDINLETSSSRKWKRTARGRGGHIWSDEGRDQCTAAYLVKEQDLSVVEWPEFPHEPGTFMYQLPVGKAHDWATCSVVAVVSHPLGEPKHVSFGNMFRMPNLGVRHDAPTLPGSSGSPIIMFEKDPKIFPDPFLIYHEGKCTKSGLNKVQSVTRSVIYTSHDKIKQCTDLLELVQFVPIFADFLLHPGDHRSSLREQTPDVCDAPSGQELSDSIRNSPSAKERLREIVQLAPSLFPDSSQRESDVFSSLLDLMVSGIPCRCRSIVRAVTGSKNPDAEIFTTTHAAPPAFNPDRPWPWSHDFSNDVPRSEQRCLLRAVLAASEWAEDAWPLVTLLMLVLNASRIATEMESLALEESRTHTRHSRAPEETPHSRRSSGSRGGEVKCQPPDDGQEEMLPSKGDPPEMVGALTVASIEITSSQVDSSELMSLLYHVVEYMNYHQGTLVAENHQKDRQFPADCLQALARWGHLRQHVLSSLQHPFYGKRQCPDAETACRCGASNSFDVLVAILNVFRTLTKAGKKLTELVQPGSFQANQWTMHDILITSLLINSFPGQWDTREDFQQGRDALSRAITSLEVYLFNCRSLLRRLRWDVQDRYLSTPVSVFGRPGNWPGNVTPPEVRDTAWRLIQEAFCEAGVKPAMLCALEQDADRREKVIDLYVDMKQLKFQGRMDRRLFIPEVIHQLTPKVDPYRKGLYLGFFRNPTVDVIFRFLVLLLDA